MGMTTTQAPVDVTYAALCKRRDELQREAGSFLARSLRPELHEPIRKASREIAEGYALEVIKVVDEMKAWRLANGWVA